MHKYPYVDEANILDPDLVRHFDLFVAGMAKTDTGKKRGRSAAPAAVPDKRAKKLV